MEKIALLLAFSEETSESVFKKFMAKYGLPDADEVHIHLKLNGPQLVVDTYDYLPDQAQYIPLLFSFEGSPTHHQGTVFITDGIARIYEPYGTYKKKLNGFEYDYYEPVAALFRGRFAGVEVWHTGAGIQSMLMAQCNRLYPQFMERFKEWAAGLELGMQKNIRERLVAIDMANESSRLIYLLEVAFMLRDRPELEGLLPLVRAYNPYLCVGLTLIESVGMHNPKFYPHLVCMYSNPIEEVYSSLEAAIADVAPELLAAKELPFIEIYNRAESLKLYE